MSGSPVDAAASLPRGLDPDVELLPDVPIAGPHEDLLARAPVAVRLAELACAQPTAQPRVVALTGAAGAGKTSVLRLAATILRDRGDVAVVELDGVDHASDEALLAALVTHLTSFFQEAGVVDTSDSIRDRLVAYGGVVSSVARIAGVKVDVAGALERSPDAIRAEIVEMTQEVGKRVVIVLDHVDRLPAAELAALVVALRHYAAIPYVSLLLAIDRRHAARRLGRDGLDVAALERLVAVELALPPVDRVLLARVLAGGLARTAARLHRDVDPVLDLFDPDGGLALDLVETPRDAKRAVNALAAALPLLPPDADLRDACLELLLRLMVPELDGPRLDARHRAEVDRAALRAELEAHVAGHRRADAARAVLRALVPGV